MEEEADYTEGKGELAEEESFKPRSAGLTQIYFLAKVFISSLAYGHKAFRIWANYN